MKKNLSRAQNPGPLLPPSSCYLAAIRCTWAYFVVTSVINIVGYVVTKNKMGQGVIGVMGWTVIISSPQQWKDNKAAQNPLSGHE